MSAAAGDLLLPPDRGADLLQPSRCYPRSGRSRWSHVLPVAPVCPSRRCGAHSRTEYILSRIDLVAGGGSGYWCFFVLAILAVSPSAMAGIRTDYIVHVGFRILRSLCNTHSIAPPRQCARRPSD